MVQPTTLKKKHSLVGKSLLPLFARFNGSPDEPRELARMDKDQPLENLDSDGIATAFKKLTGENIGDVLAALGKQSGAGVALLHHAIVLANEIGQPVGQPLRDPPITPPGVSDDVSEPPRKVQRIACQATVADPVQKAKAKGMDILGYEIQDWEFQIPFDPQRAVASKHLSPQWTTLDGREPRLSTHQCPDFESVINDGMASRRRLLSGIDLQGINNRLDILDERHLNSEMVKRKTSEQLSLEHFFSLLPFHVNIQSCTPQHLRRYLVWRDVDGKTKVHDVKCLFLGDKSLSTCLCPTRLAHGTLITIVQRLSKIFEEEGRGKEWCTKSETGNPAKSNVIKLYLKQISEEQAKAQIVPKQAKPLFLSKLEKISSYIDNQLSRPDITLRQRFVLFRDQAFFRLQFFAGDRVSDLSGAPSQSVRYLADNTGMAVSHTYTKVIRGDGRCNTFVIKRCDNAALCPVSALERYSAWAKSAGVDLSLGYLFRLVSDSGKVLDQCVSYAVMYSRLLEYLTTLNIYEGETPHSLRSGCAITLKLSGAADSNSQTMRHVGWFKESSCSYYSREDSLKEPAQLAQRLASSPALSGKIESDYQRYSTFNTLNHAI
ncbi:uncharacterized protein LOC135494071 [Lineus longissimus]|uniref:uncharacterized protein LOC135494071 n=1 Tax=Lineus longissimus TaxID=88925 RepID=UPI00315D5797